MSDQIREKRIGIVGVVLIAIFLTLVCRLWYLQVANGEEFRQVASANHYRTVQTEAPRGRILDANGVVLVDNRIARSIVVERLELKDEKIKKKVIEQLSVVLGVDRKTIETRIADLRVSQYKPVPVAIDVDIDKIQYIKEHQEDFPGVDAIPLPIRRYPQGNVAPHVVGYVGEIFEDELKARKDENYQIGDTIGKSGVELAYEKYLRGTPSISKVEVDRNGSVIRTAKYTPPIPGDDIVLSIDVTTQKVAEESLAGQIEQTRKQQDRSDKAKFSTFKAPSGSVTLLDPNTGLVRAMASYPTYDPAAFVGGISTQDYQALNAPNSGFPLNNWATQGQYAPGSTFKLVSSIAGLESGIVTTNSPFNDTGSLKVSDVEFFNAGKQVNGTITLPTALTVSSDTYFYNIGSKLWSLQRKKNPEGDAIQNVAREFGFGKPTGIPIGNESKGRIADQEWKKKIHEADPVNFPYAEWLPGENVFAAIGQGDNLATPIQLATAYGAFLNGGKVLQPQLVQEIRKFDKDGKFKSTFIDSKVNSTVTVNPNYTAVIKQGFAGVVDSEKGTAHSVFLGWPSNISVGGKTGTAEVQGKQDTSLFVGFSPVDNPQFVAVSVVEQAGFGAATAAPIVRRTLEGAYGLPLSNFGYVTVSDGGAR